MIKKYTLAAIAGLLFAGNAYAQDCTSTTLTPTSTISNNDVVCYNGSGELVATDLKINSDGILKINSGTVRIEKAIIGPNAKIIVAPGATLKLMNNINLNGTIENKGTVNSNGSWMGGTIAGSGKFVNTGTINLQYGGAFPYSLVNNTGGSITLDTKAPSTATTINNSGTMTLKGDFKAAIVNNANGTLNLTNSLNFSGDSIANLGNMSVSVNIQTAGTKIYNFNGSNLTISTLNIGASNVVFYNNDTVVTTYMNNFNDKNFTFINDSKGNTFHNSTLDIKSTKLKNNGLISINGSLNVNSTGTSRVENYGYIKINSNLDIKDSFSNYGMVAAGGDVTLDNGKIANYCRMFTNGNNIHVNGVFYNYGLFALTKSGSQFLVNANGRLRMSAANAVIDGYNFQTSSSSEPVITGQGLLYFRGTTNNYGAMSGNGSNSQLNFFDATRTGSQTFDNGSGAATNVVRPATASAFDTSSAMKNCNSTTTLSSNFYNLYLVYNPAAPLPVTLQSFAASNSGNGWADINWVMAEQEAGLVFELQRSTDGKNFNTVATIDAGNEQYNATYNYQDNINGISGNIYYRLMMLPIGKEATYSNTARINNGNTTATASAVEASIAANPFHGTLNLYINAAQDNTPAAVSVIDMSGRIVYQTNINLLIGNNALSISETASLAAGSYLVRIATAAGNTTLRAQKL